MSSSNRFPKLDPAKYLQLSFEGYFMCRLATDPDPTSEERGMSGYTMALNTEDPLDQTIQLHPTDKYLKKNLRKPAKKMGLKKKLQKGVRVNGVTFDGRPLPKHPLVNARVKLLGHDEPFDGPIFEGRNNITGSGDNYAFIVEPFKLLIEQEANGRKSPKRQLYAEDYLQPDNPEKKIWEIIDPKIYGRRLGAFVSSASLEVQEAINVYDDFGYFRSRRRFLEEAIESAQEKLEKSEPGSKKHKKLELEIEQFKSRLFQLEYWGDRVINKMGSRADWSFEINGRKWATGDIEGEVDRDQPWPVKFWFGGWDGDLLAGYMRGSLSVPFTLSKRVK